MKRQLCLWFPHWPVQRLHITQPALRDQHSLIVQNSPRGHARSLSAGSVQNKPSVGDRPLILVRPQRGREVVVDCCRSARRAGVRPGLPIAEARVCWESALGNALRPRFVPEDLAADLSMLKMLAADCEAFSPLVGLEDRSPPSSLWIDISGAATCFHGEPNLVAQLLQAMHDRGLQARIGVADTWGVAWAVSHFGTREREWVIVPPGCGQEALLPLPIEALRLPAETVRKLHDLDIRRISQLLSLPRRSLPSRFGQELLLRIDQALGHAPETIVPERPPQPLEEVWESESPLLCEDAVDTVTASLVERLATKLNQEGMGILALRCELEAAGSPGQPISPDGPFSEGRGSCRAGTLDAPATCRAAPQERRPPVEHLYVVEYRVRLLRPTVDARHVMSLLRLQWERRSLPEGITRIRIVISERAPLQVIEQTLWNMGDRQTSQDAAALLEKLTSRLGRDRVLRAVLQADGQPELAYRYEPCLEPPDPRIRSPDTANPVIHFRLSRPLWCERTPTPVEVVSFVPDGLPPGGCSERFVHSGRVLDPQDRCEQSSCAGPPWRLTWQGEEYLIARSWGPERITTGWLRGAHIRRDYYHVETTDGHRLWLFRDRIEDRWYLQAAFD